MEKALFKNIFLNKIFICKPIFKIFVALFKTFGMLHGEMQIFFLRSFRKVRFRKMQFLKDGVQTVVPNIGDTMVQHTVRLDTKPFELGQISWK